MTPRILRPLVGLVVATAALVGCGPTSPDGPPAEAVGTGLGATLDGDAFASLVGEPDVVVLDVRTPEEFASGHLPDAVNLDVSDPGFPEAVAALDPTGTYAVYCRSGNRSAQAVAVMLDAGVQDVAHLEGGIAAWQGEVVTD
ncbi:rhodanese-like domain-containing protein [Cellulomonas sp. APG4]|uniref:rhodanese-like domain-containing protein n=1 Tax=Cellulomonas sp. APG4 TaxID=1538656 RepID=UPI00137ACC31|nr:rhodanese-like domain-containing protein [Cellulomonas sp. APG4]NCT90942.1 rhodanese-like domain-containing protein [Cellulomonas sp. APG4]